MALRINCSHVPTSCRAAPRRVYIDAGVNWGNTARLFTSFEPPNASAYSPWEVVGFDAAPLIQPYADRFYAWLDGGARESERPETCLPPTGSSRHLNAYASAYGCPTYEAAAPSTPAKAAKLEAMVACMQAKLERHLLALRAEPRFLDGNSTALLESRLRAACPWSHDRRHAEASRSAAATTAAAAGTSSCERRARSTPRTLACSSSRCARTTDALHAGTRGNLFTFIPAAASASEGSDALEVFAPPQSMLRGGAVPASIVQDQDAKARHTYRVATVNVPHFIEQTVAPEDHVVMKMDIEGAEHAILGEMLAAGTMSRIDVLALECHSWTTHGLAAPKRAYRTCSSLLRELAKANPRMRLVTESAGAPGYEGGHDAHSAPPSAAELARTVQRCA